MKWLLAVFVTVSLLFAKPVVADSTAPDFTLAALGGMNLRLAEQRGDIIVLNFWASWCGPCLQEMPALDALATKYAPLGVQVWGVNVESDNRSAQAYLQRVKVNFPILFDEQNEVSKAYQVKAMPTTVIIDKDGQIRAVHLGYKPGYENKYENNIKDLLRE